MHHLSIRLAIAVAAIGVEGCLASTHDVTTASLGTPRRAADLLSVVDTPGPVEVETVVSTHWKVTRAGLLNLDSPKAKAAHLDDGDEPIEVFFHVVRHPRFGTFLIDTGVERAMRDAADDAAVRGLIAQVMHTETMTFDDAAR